MPTSNVNSVIKSLSYPPLRTLITQKSNNEAVRPSVFVKREGLPCPSGLVTREGYLA